MEKASENGRVALCLLKLRVRIVNTGWSDWVQYIDGKLAKFSLLVPLVGYLILFNDAILEYVDFTSMVPESVADWWFDTDAKLRMIYFGLVFLGISNVIYIMTRPVVFKTARTVSEWQKYALEHMSFAQLREMHDELILHPAYKLMFDHRSFMAFDHKAGYVSDEELQENNYKSHWDDAKRQFGGVLLAVSEAYFDMYSRSKLGWLTVCIFLSTLGYLLLILPSIDMFRNVVISTYS